MLNGVEYYSFTYKTIHSENYKYIIDQNIIHFGIIFIDNIFQKKTVMIYIKYLIKCLKIIHIKDSIDNIKKHKGY